MGTEIKYLSDGRKVAVIGHINNTESIVQEIFITKDGDEIPSGEKFTTKSLHDNPVISYRDKQIAQKELSLKRLDMEIDKMNIVMNNVEIKLKTIKDILKNSEKFMQTFKDNDLEMLSSFFAGAIKYIVEDGCSISRPILFINAINDVDTSYTNKRYNGLKLLCLFGGSDGDLEFRLNRYSDGSGGWTNIKGFGDYQSAIDYIKCKVMLLVEKENISVDCVKKCKEMGIVFSKDETLMIKSILDKDIMRRQSKHDEMVEKSLTKIDESMKEINELLEDK